MMTLTPQLRKTAIKKRASHPSSFRESDLNFRKLVDKLEQTEITMKLEETENLKLQYVNRIETNTTHINTRNIQTLKADHPSENGVIFADDLDTLFPNLDKNNKTIRINLKSTKNQINHSINT